MESKKVSGNEDDESVSIISESPTIKLKNRRRYEAPLFIQHESVLRNKENSEIRMSTTPSITPRISSAKSTDKRKLEQKPANSYKAKMKKTPSSSRLTATSKAKQTPGTTRQSTGVLINQPNYSVSIIEYRNKKQVRIDRCHFSTLIVLT